MDADKVKKAPDQGFRAGSSSADALDQDLPVFADFRAAMAFMVRVGFEADAMDHHPEWTNVYNKVAVRLNTHSAGGKVTAKDIVLAGRIEKVVS